MLPLGLDTFAVATALGLAGTGGGGRLRVSLLFTTFEAVMPLVGLGLGAPLGRAIGTSADFIAVAVLLAVGVYALIDDDGEARQLAALAGARGRTAVLLGLSVSLDELAIGFTLGLLRLPAALVIVLIALQAFIVTQLGLRLGARLGTRWREAAERLAGVALTALALALLIERLLA